MKQLKQQASTIDSHSCQTSSIGFWDQKILYKADVFGEL